jgi:hypothetical protein
MGGLAILTPTFERDLEYFRDLHESVLRFTDDDVRHYVVVPRRDLPLFKTLQSGRMTLLASEDLLPSRFISTYALSRSLRKAPKVGGRVPPIQAVNLRHPWPPVRGWIVQQIVKLAVVAGLDVDVVLAVDSDIALIRRLDVDRLVSNGSVRFYRSSEPLTSDLTRHARWHVVARELLGLPGTSADAHDYVSSPVAWDPRIVREMLMRIQSVGGRSWFDMVAGHLHFSECILYGLYVDALGGDADRSFTASNTLCHTYWGQSPLDELTARSFLESIDASDVAINIQSTTGTALDVRRLVIATAQGRGAVSST